VSRATLRSHQKKNKACLVAQAEAESHAEENTISCQYCNIIYTENEWQVHQSECYRSALTERDEKIIALQNDNTHLQLKIDIISAQLVKSMLEMKQMSAFIQTFCKPCNDLTPALQS